MKSRIPAARRAFTLTETMITATIFSALAAMILLLVLNVNWSLFDSQNKNTIDKNLRTTTSALTRLVGAADFTYVMTSLDEPISQDAKLTGDLFVAVYYQNPGQIDPVSKKMDTTVARIVGFCRVPGADGKAEGAPLYMFDSADISAEDWGVKFPAASDETADSIAKLLPTSDKVSKFTKLADAAFATHTSGKIFINNDNGTGALMLARIRNGMNGRYVSNAYAFSVSSRNL